MGSRVFVSFVFLISGLSFAEASPWKISQQRESPWGGSGSSISRASSDRVAQRESFFQKLSSGQKTRPSHYVQTPVADLDRLPWGDYDREYSKDFSEDFLWPVAGGKISSGYGVRHGRPHEGLDIRAERGSMIRAAADGKVVFSGWMQGYGRILVIAHGDSFSTIYAHNDANLVDRGQSVRRGQNIAKLGATGKVSGPHLHFEVRQKGKPLNPLRFHYEGRWEAS